MPKILLSMFAWQAPCGLRQAADAPLFVQAAASVAIVKASDQGKTAWKPGSTLSDTQKVCTSLQAHTLGNLAPSWAAHSEYAGLNRLQAPSFGMAGT